MEFIDNIDIFFLILAILMLSSYFAIQYHHNNLSYETNWVIGCWILISLCVTCSLASMAYTIDADPFNPGNGEMIMAMSALSCCFLCISSSIVGFSYY